MDPFVPSWQAFKKSFSVELWLLFLHPSTNSFFHFLVMSVSTLKQRWRSHMYKLTFSCRGEREGTTTPHPCQLQLMQDFTFTVISHSRFILRRVLTEIRVVVVVVVVVV
jgi:hypothetical protein